MSKYPVETADMDGVIAGVNYLLSGPQGTGQNYSGQSSTNIGFLSANPRDPFTFPLGSTYQLTVAPVSLGTSEMLDERTFKFTFATPTVGYPLFNLGCPIIVKGVSDPTYNQQYGPIGVVECTNDYVIARTETPFTIVGTGTGGTVEFRVVFDLINDTVEQEYYVGQIRSPLIATASVTSISDRVLVSGQMSANINYTCTSDSSLTVIIGIFRSRVINQGDQTSPKYITEGFVPVFSEQHIFNYTTGDSGAQNVSFIAAGFIDQDQQTNTFPVGLYEYTMAIDLFGTNADNVSPVGIDISYIDSGLGTIVAQVIKQ